MIDSTYVTEGFQSPITKGFFFNLSLEKHGDEAKKYCDFLEIVVIKNIESFHFLTPKIAELLHFY